MKVLLTAINAKYIHSNLAIYSLKQYAKKYSEQIALAEYTINNYTDFILQDIYKKKPDILALSCYIWNIDMVKEVARELKKILPNMKIWVGGPEVSYNATEFLQEEKYVEGVMIGEGEETFLALMDYYLAGKGNLSDIEGIAYRKDREELVVTPPRKPLDLSLIPFPYEDISQFQNKIIYYETSRGCPYSCSYCLSSIEKGVRLRSIELVERELQLFIDYEIPQVKFIDRTFNCNVKHAMHIWNYIKEHDKGITNFHFEISADILTEEELVLLNSMREGLVQLEIGVQSTNPKTIEAIHRRMDFEKLSYAVKRVREGNNIHQHLDLIAGLPYEDSDSFRKSFEDVYALAPNQLQLGFLKVLKGSRMQEEKNTHEILHKAVAPYEVLATKWLPYDEVLKLKKVEDMVEVYYNSCQFTHSIKYLIHFYNASFDFFKALGDYYEEEKLQGISHSRMGRYQILLDYVKKYHIELVPVFKEILIYDLYLRENVKSRPAYASNQEEWKEGYRNFFQQEECIETYLPHYRRYQARQIARMTHMEHVTLDIEVTVESGQTIKKDQFILFDYQKRNALSQEARTVFLEKL